MRFFSDNTSSACPELMAALSAANHGLARAYGDDEWTQRLDRTLSEFFGTEVRAFAVTTGTAANSLALATLSPPYGAIFAHDEAHIAVDECGAPGLLHRRRAAGAAARRARPSRRRRPSPPRSARTAWTCTRVQPAALSLTQATELGTVYRPEQIAAARRVRARATG